MRTGITVLGSGSGGNSILVHEEKNGILVDAGFSRRELLSRLASAQIDAGIIRAVLVSHEHGDHTKGASAIASSLGIPVYMTSKTHQCLAASGKELPESKIFESGSLFEIAGFRISPFSVPHDAVDPVGFVITRMGVRIGIATDLGHLNSLCVQRLAGCDALILESNHDVEMQKMSQRHIVLKHRVLGKFGHLNNDDALDSFQSLFSEKTRFVCLSHLSSECNSFELVRNLALKKLAELGREDILLAVAEQNRFSPTVWISESGCALAHF